MLERLGESQILGLTLGLDVAAELHPLVARDRLHEAWVRFAAELANERPAVVLVEDLHWAERELLDLLELLLRAVEGPLLLVSTARPELLDRRPGWGGARRAATTIELAPLSTLDAGQMLDELLGTNLSGDLRDVIVQEGEGNPFFLEELLGTLIDQGVLTRTDGFWAAGKLSPDLAIPDSVQAVLAARIDLLAPDEKAALQAASVIGRVFWPGPVYELVPGISPDFRILEDRDFIRRRPGTSIAGEVEFAFKHQVTREVAYGSLPKARRAHLHAGFAAWLERFGLGRDEYASLLAHHYAAAVRPEDADLAWPGEADELRVLSTKAVEWLARAAHLATGRYELGEALALLNQGLGLPMDPATRIGLLREAAEAHLLNFDMEGYRSAMEKALALGPDRAAAAEIYTDLAEYGHARRYMWKQPPPAEVGERWLARALELSEPGTATRGLALLTHALAEPGSREAAAAAEEALALSEALEAAEEIGGSGYARLLTIQALEAQMLVATAKGRFEEACAWTERILATAPSVGNPGLLAHLYWLSGFAFLRAGRVSEVAPLVTEHERLAATTTRHDVVHAVAHQAVLESVRGAWEAGQWACPPCGGDRGGQRSDAVSIQLAHADRVRPRQRPRRRRARGPAPRRARPRKRRRRRPSGARAALLRLALRRSDLDEAERILQLLPAEVDPWGADGPAARLDALAALGERERVEEEAAPFLDDESYTRPFAVRALGLVRADRELLAEAEARFLALGLEWHAAETRALRPGLTR